MEKFSPEELKRIGARIRDLRKKKNMSQADLAEAAHIGLPRISPIESGKAEMYISTLVKIAAALDVSTDMILRPNTPAVNSVYQTEFQAGIRSAVRPFHGFIKLDVEAWCIRKANCKAHQRL